MEQIIEGKVISKVAVHDAVNSFGLHFANTLYIFLYASYHMLPVITPQSTWLDFVNFKNLIDGMFRKLSTLLFVYQHCSPDNIYAS